MPRYLLPNHDDFNKRGSLWSLFSTSEPSKPAVQPNRGAVVVTTKEPQSNYPFSYNTPGTYALS